MIFTISTSSTFSTIISSDFLDSPKRVVTFAVKSARKNLGKREMNKYFLVLAVGMILFSMIPCREAFAGSWEQLTPEEQQVLRRFREQWNQLPGERQERLRRGAERWQRMTPEERKEAEERFKRWQELSPQEKEMIRKRYQDFRNLPPEEQERIRRGDRWFQDLTPQQRQDLREQWQKSAPRDRKDLRPGRQ